MKTWLQTFVVSLLIGMSVLLGLFWNRLGTAQQTEIQLTQELEESQMTLNEYRSDLDECLKHHSIDMAALERVAEDPPKPMPQEVIPEKAEPKKPVKKSIKKPAKKPVQKPVKRPIDKPCEDCR